jgi:hypothetical protein
MKSAITNSTQTVKSARVFPRFNVVKILSHLVTDSSTTRESSNRATLFNLASHRCAGFVSMNDKKKR